MAGLRRYAEIVAMRAPMFFVSLVVHYFAARSFGIALPFVQVLAFLPVIFMAGALPITVAHLGTTQAAWILFFGRYAATPRLLAFSLAAHLGFIAMRTALSLAFVAPASNVLGGSERRPRSVDGSRMDDCNDWALH